MIYRTNMATSYAAGRMAQLIDGKFNFWIYKHGPALEPRVQHLAWDGIALPPDHPFWQTHAPPNGWGCTCEIRGANTEAGIRRAKGDPGKKLPDGWQVPDPKTGVPSGIDKGWDYAPGRSVARTVALAAKKIAALPPEVGSSYGAGLQGVIERAWPTWVADTTVRGSHEPGLVGVISRPVIGALTNTDIAPASAEIMVKPGLLIDPKASRHAGEGDNLSITDWLALPRLLRFAPVYLDVKTNRLLFLIDADGSSFGQLAMAMDYQIKVKRSKQLTNMVVSAYRISPKTAAERIRSGELLLIMAVTG